MALWGRLITPFFLFSAFLLLLLVSLSIPIIQSIYIFDVVATDTEGAVKTSIGTSVRFGLWGYCVGAYQFTGSKASFVATSQCSTPKLGYTFDTALLNLIGNSSLVEAVLRGLTVVLVLHPIACGLALLTLAGALFYALRPTIPHAVPICSLLIAIIPAILTTIVFVIDIVVVIIARLKIQQATNGGLTVRWGNAVWMTAGAIAAMWISVIGLSAVACGCFGLGRRKGNYKEYVAAQMHEKDPRFSTIGPPIP